MLLAAATVIISCSKDDNDNNGNGGGSAASGNTAKLCGKNWKLTSVLNNGVEFIQLIDSCELDNIRRFSTNNTYTEDEGATKCDPADPQTTSGIWSWAASETQLITDTVDTFNVVVNSGTMLKISPVDTSGGLFVFTFEL